MSELEKAQKRAWRFYKTLKKKRIFCPAIKREVQVSNLGWRHLSNHARPTKRTTQDLLHRFELLLHVEQLISNATKAKKHMEHNRVFYVLEEMLEERIIRIILIEDTKEKVIFLSIIDKT